VLFDCRESACCDQLLHMRNRIRIRKLRKDHRVNVHRVLDSLVSAPRVGGHSTRMKASSAGGQLWVKPYRVHSEVDAQDALLRASAGFAGRLAGGACAEFWLDVTKHVFHKDDRSAQLRPETDLPHAEYPPQITVAKFANSQASGSEVDRVVMHSQELTVGLSLAEQTHSRKNKLTDVTDNSRSNQSKPRKKENNRGKADSSWFQERHVPGIGGAQPVAIDEQ